MPGNPKGMETFKLETIDGVTYPCCLGADDMTHQLALVRDFEVRHDDVIIVGLPKSGNHWTFEVVSMIVRQNRDYEKDQYISHMLDYSGHDMPQKLEKLNSPRVLGLHAFMDKLPEQVIQKKAKVIFLIRNPKDVWTSAYHMYSNLELPELHYSGTWDDFFQLRMRGEFIFDTWFANVLGAEKFMRDHPDVPVHIRCFERMKENPVAAIEELCRFLGQPTHLAEDIAKATAFKAMKSQLQGDKMGDMAKDLFKKNQTGIMRKGEVGDWKNYFTEAQSQAFNELFDEEMKDSKLGELVRPYI